MFVSKTDLTWAGIASLGLSLACSMLLATGKHDTILIVSFAPGILLGILWGVRFVILGKFTLRESAPDNQASD